MRSIKHGWNFFSLFLNNFFLPSFSFSTCFYLYCQKRFFLYSTVFDVSPIMIMLEASCFTSGSAGVGFITVPNYEALSLCSSSVRLIQPTWMACWITSLLVLSFFTFMYYINSLLLLCCLLWNIFRYKLKTLFTKKFKRNIF